MLSEVDRLCLDLKRLEKKVRAYDALLVSLSREVGCRNVWEKIEKKLEEIRNE